MKVCSRCWFFAFFLFFFSIVGGITQTSAATIAVSPGQSIQAVCLDQVQPGDTCILNAGSYSSGIDLILKTSGTETSPITLVGVGNVTIQDKIITKGGTVHYYTIMGENSQYPLKFEKGLDFAYNTPWDRESEDLGNNGYIIRNCYVTGEVLVYGHYNLIENCEFAGNGSGTAIWDQRAASHHNVYRNNNIHDYSRGIWTMDNTHYITIEGNTISNTVHQAIDCDGYAMAETHCDVIDNVITHSNPAIQMENAFDSTVSGNIISNQNDYAAIHIKNYGEGPDFWKSLMEYRGFDTNMIVKGNLIYSSTMAGILIEGAKTGLIENNTIYYSQAPSGIFSGIALRVYGGFYSSDWIIKNNIIDSPGYVIRFDSASNTPNFISNNNLFSSTSGFLQGTFPRSFTQWQDLGLDSDSILSSPQFVDSVNGDFSLNASSPACAGGENQTYQGAFSCGGMVPHTFPDVDLNDVFAEYINTLYSLGIISGYSDGTYRPDESVTRAQLAKFIVNGFDLGSDDSGEQFPDIDKNSSLASYVQVLRNSGIIDGFSDGTFRPDTPVSRGAATKFIVNAMEQIGIDVETDVPSGISFSDVGVGNTFGKYIMFLSEKQVVGGYSDGTFKPTGNLTRGQMAKMITLAIDIKK